MGPLLLLFLVGGALAALTDLNCTTVTATGTFFTPMATICSDKAPLAVCEQLFGGTTPDKAVTVGEPVATRPEGCFTTKAGAALSNEVKQAAIANCASYCGFCCATPEYNCQNNPNPRIDCGQVTQGMCQSVQWREVIAQDCPAACGFCLLGGCIDAAADCVTQPTICSNPALSNFTMYNCKRTCGQCTGSAFSTLYPGGGGCGDFSNNCANWVRNGFCNSQFYTTQQKSHFCGTSCGLCGGAFGGMFGAVMTTPNIFG